MMGDPVAARQRAEAMRDFKVLAASPGIERLAQTYREKLDLPDKAIRDATHLAYAVQYGVDYLLTWNCAHLANAEVGRKLAALNRTLGIGTPAICTPEELMGVEGESRDS